MQSLPPPITGQFDPKNAGIDSRLFALAGANAASVMSLYLGQVLARVVASDFPAGTAFLSLIPGATLVGYAGGVAVIAFRPAGNIRLSVPAHLGLLAMALCSAGLAPTATALAIASLVVGAGAAVAQRLLAAAGKLGGTTHGGVFIGKTICAALTAVLVIRMAGDVFAQLLGWRTTFFLAAAVVAWFGILNYRRQAAGAPSCSASLTAPTTSVGLVAPLWRQSRLLRWAVFQHGAMFAAYNLAWMTILVEVPAQERAAVVVGGGGTGVIMAFLAGYWVDRFAQRDLARCGVAAVAIATALLLPIAYSSAPGLERVLLLLPGMALLDGGLQIALVANQTRTQALLPDARPRLAALLTVCGSLSGAASAGLGYWLWQQFGWQPAIGLAALSSLLGLGCATLAGLKRLNNHAAPANQSNSTHKAAMPHPAILRGLRWMPSPMFVRTRTRTT